MINKKNTNKEIGERIKKLRIQKSLSQLDLAKKINVDNQQVCKYEHGKILPAAETLIKLSKALGVTIDYILLGELKGEAANRLHDKKLLELFTDSEHLPENDKNIIKGVVSALIVKNKVEGIKLK